MAKRKRLSPARMDTAESFPTELETKSLGFPATPSRAPIAQVAGEAAATAALEELAGEVKRARDEGRMIQSLPIKAIRADYLQRDRIAADTAELDELVQSIRDRGQQTPIEVVELEDGLYGLISGWRRLTALRRLAQEGDGAAFDTVLAILRKPDTAADAYVAMVEENEIRLGLSYYERARIAAIAVKQSVYDSEKQALLQLFSTASRTKRSKIRSFLVLYHAADDVFVAANAIPERLGMALAREIEDAPEHRETLRQALTTTPRKTAEDELAVLQNVLDQITQKQALTPDLESNIFREETAEPAEPAPADPTAASSGRHNVSADLWVCHRPGLVELRGPAVTPALREKLLVWLHEQAG